ncbi:hypothetical protein AAY473_007320 [Plecturocebus cupreus]
MAPQQVPKHLPSRGRGNYPPLVKSLSLGNGGKRRPVTNLEKPQQVGQMVSGMGIRKT